MPIERIDELYRLVEGEAPSFAEAIEEAVRASRNEREFQTAATGLIEEFAGKVGVDLLLREEYTLATGRADAVYNRLIIEYERPGSLRLSLTHGHTRHALDQVRQYIADVAKKEKHDRDRLLGVAFDGTVMIFGRYRNGHWYEEPPLEVNRYSVTRFLRSLVSLSSGRALIPENLVEDFGAQNLYSQRVARALYHALEGHRDDLTGNLFRQWQLFFSQVSGYEEATTRLRDKKELRQFARGMGLSPETTDPPRLFFATHTYFSFLVKAIARLVLERHAGGRFGATPLTVLANLEGDALKRELERLEDGGIFHTLGLTNLLEGDFFSWYLQAWSVEVEGALRLTLSRLAEYNPATIEDDPFAARDLLKKLYHYLLPRELRHDLGEYYTPDWLAERVLTQLNEPLYVMPKSDQQPARLFPARRLLDPACGSGTFLILAIRTIKEHCIRQGLAEADTLEYILANVVGIDLNPLAVMAARVNYLLAIAELVPYRREPITIPVYLADSVLTPTEGATLFEQNQRRLKTVVGDLPVPSGINSKEAIAKLTDLLDEYVPSQFSTDAFVERACNDLGLSRGGLDEATLRELYKTLADLEQKGLDGIWARVLKNAFMPLFIGRFDYVAGNPPWVNWENLPDGYRQETTPVWTRYKLFLPKGFRAILGGSKDDISILMTYVACDKYLKEDGRLGFLITQSVFKTAEAGRGFRQLRLGEKEYLRVSHVDDLSNLNPFEGAANRTCGVIIDKGKATRYPVPYTLWRKTTRGVRLGYDSSLDEVQSITTRLNLQAVPIHEDDLTSAWLTGRPGAIRALRRIIGKSAYQARKGVTASVNGVFWVEVIEDVPGGLVLVRNVTERGKKSVEPVTTAIEPHLLYPLLRGRDVQRWLAESKLHVLVTHEEGKGLKAIPEPEMEHTYPKTLAYLRANEMLLRQAGLVRRYFTRKDSRGRVIETGPFYSMFNIGDYTFSDYKVVWREVSADFAPAVVGCSNGRPVIPDHTLTTLACGSESEAHFVCAVLGSTAYRVGVNAYIALHPSPHVVENFRVPAFDTSNTLHEELSALSKTAHGLASLGSDEVKDIEEEIDRAVARLLGIPDADMLEIKRNLEEMLA